MAEDCGVHICTNRDNCASDNIDNEPISSNTSGINIE